MGLLRRVDVGLGHDLEQRHAGAIQIHERVVAPVVDRLPRVFLEVDPAQTHESAAILGDAVERDPAPELKGRSYCDIWYPFGRSG